MEDMENGVRLQTTYVREEGKANLQSPLGTLLLVAQLIDQRGRCLSVITIGFGSIPRHLSVCTSTDSTAGRSLTIGAQLSPASDEAYTWPPQVPKYTPHSSSESTAMASRNTLT